MIKLKRAVFGAMAGLMVINTPLTTLAAYAPTTESTEQTVKVSDKNGKDQDKKSVLEQKDMYAYLSKMKDEDRKEVLTGLSNEEDYELVVLLQYEYLNTFSKDQSLELYKEVVDGYWKTIPDLKTDDEKEEYESRLSDWQDTAFEYVDTEEEDSGAYLNVLFKEKSYGKELYQILTEYMDEKGDVEKQTKSEKVYEALKDQNFSGGGINQDTSTDKKETSESSKDEKSDTIVDDKSSEETGNSEGTEKKDEVVETPDESKDEQDSEQKNDSAEGMNQTTADNADSSEETAEDLTLTKKELKSLMDNENFDVKKFMKREYESKNYCFISSEIKNDEKKTFLANRTEEEMYQILLITKYTLFNEYLRYSTFEVEKTDMTDMTAFLTDYRFMLEQWLEIELGDEDHLTDEQKRSLEQEVLLIILEKENLNGIGSFSEYDEILKKKTTKIDMPGLMDIFDKIDFTSKETLESTFNDLVNYTYKIYGMESMNGEPISPKPSLSKRRVRSAVAASTTPSNGQEVSVANGLYYITSYTSSFALQTDANGKVDKTNVTLWSATGSGFGRAEQRWMIQKQSNGWYKIIANSSYKIPDDGIGHYYNAKKCLDVVDGSKAAGTNVDIYTNNSTDAQYWKFYYYNGRYIIKNKLGCVLDVKDGNIASGTNVHVFTQNNSNAQQWTLSKITNDTVYLDKRLTKSGNGYSASSPVRNMSEAYDLLQYCGGTVYILGKAWNITTTVTLTESSYTNTGGYPSNINLLSGCKLTIKRYSGYKGEMMTVASNGNLTLKNLTMDGNRSNVTKCTGVMLSNKGKLYLNNCIFQNAYSYNVPAALWSSNNFTADKCTFKNNTPYRDSGSGPASTYTVSCQGGDSYNGAYTFNNCTFSGNSDQSAVEIFHGMGYFTSCNFTNNTNTSTDGYAAAIGFNGAGGTLTNCTFEGNVSSKDGGAIHVNNSGDTDSAISKCPFTAKSCIFKNNKAGANGGVVMLWSSHQVNKFESCQFLNNTAGGSGGCITVGGLSQAYLLSNTFDGNTATGNGGAINEGSSAGKLSLESSKNIFTNNTGKNRGGAIYTTTKASVKDNTFTSNTAGSGGAIDFNGKSGNFEASGNTYTSNSSTFEGGAVCIGAADSTKLDNEYFEKNSSISGGAVAVTYKNTTIRNSQFYNNSVAPNSNNMYGSGGAVYVRNATNVALTGNTYNGNTARWGGAVDIQGDTSVTLTDEVMTSNQTTGGGGAIHNNGTSTKIVNGTYTDNYSPTSGGAICNSGIMTISYSSDGDTSGIFKNNTAGTDGGAISSYVQDIATPTVTLSGITFEGNNSKVGGAIYVQKNTVLNSSNTTYKNNAATLEGGAICNKGIVSMDSGTVTGNTAPEGAAICQNGTLELSKLATIATDNDIYLHNNKFITVPTALSNNFVARITPSDYTLGRTCVRNTYGAKGSTLEPKFTLTPNGSYFLYGGDLISNANDTDVVISKNYTITYDANGGTEGPENQKKKWNVDTVISSKKPTQKGYVFEGWNTEADGSGDDYFPGDDYTENEDLTLYAQWMPIKYTVTYDGNGSTSGSMLTQTFTYGTSYNLAANGFVRSGYHFTEWNTKADGSGTSYANKQSVKNLASTNGAKVILYAQWVKDNYTIRFHANGGTGSMADVTVPYDTSYKLPANKFTYQGYTFDKWKTEDGTSVFGNEAAIKYSSSQLKNGVLDLYAQWKINQYTLTITGDSGVEKITGSGTYNYGTTANVTYQIKPGYHIKNITGTTADGDPNGAWTGHAGKGGAVTDTWTMKACNRTIVVHTEPNTYTVKYDGNGNTGGSTASSSHTYDTAKALTANGFTKTGYTFKGWNTKADGSGTAYADKASVKNLTTTNGGTVTLYAQWAANEYTVTYNANGGIGTMGTDTVSYGTGYVTRSNAFTRTGYTFKGWNEKADGTGTDWTSWIGKSWTWTYTKNITLYAQWTANQYQLTLNPNSGSFSDGTTAAKILNPNLIYNGDNWWNISAQAVSRTGYTFDGWYDKASGGEKVYDANGSCVTGTYWKNGKYQHTGSLTVYAHWTAKNVTVTFHRNADSNDTTTSQQTFTYDVAGQKFTDKGWSKTGYILLGWSTDKNATNASYSVTSGVSNDWINKNSPKVDLYGVWKANTYTVKYDGNGSTGGSTASSSHTYDTAKALTANGYTRTGYSFNGWNTQADGKGTAYADKVSVKNLTSTNGATITLYAQWTKNSYYLDLNGWLDGKSAGNITGYGTADIYVDGVQKANDVTDFYQKIPYGSKYEIKDIKTVTGHTYVGVHSGSITGTIGTSNVGVVLEFRTNKYTVTFDKNNGTGTMTDQTFTYGVKQALTKNAFTRTGYTFTGWNTQADGKGTAYTDQQEVTSLSAADGATVKLYAQWTAISYTVTYDGNGSTGGSTASGNHTYDTVKALTANGYTRTGYSFNGWNTKADGSGTSYADKASVKNLSSTNGATVTLYAQWTANKYTVTYDANGGAGTMAADTVSYGSGYVTKANAFSRTGYTFKGWNEKADGTGTDWTSWIGKSWTWTYTKNITLYAQWTANQYQLTLNPNNGAFSDGTTTAKTISPNLIYNGTNWWDISSQKVSRTGYAFDGWYDKTSGGEKVYDVNGSCVTGTYWKNGKYQYTGNLTVYAHWTAKSVTVTFHRNTDSNDTTTSQQTFTYDVAGQKFTDKGWSKTGYTLLGWSTDKNATNASYFVTNGVSNDWINKNSPKVDLYGVWKANTYTVKYDGNGSTGGSTASSSHAYDTAKTLTVNGFTKAGYTFKNWNTKANGSGTAYADKASVKNLTSTNGGTVTLYAQWTANKYTIVFSSNGGTGTMANQEMTYDKAENLNANTFKRTGYRFEGWNTKADGTGTSYADKVSVKNLSSIAGSTVTLYAKWYSAAPELDAKNVTYYEGETVTKSMLLKNVTKASDAEDGDMSGKVIITKIEYAAGKLVDGKSQAAYTKSWTNGMPDSEKLDTWFLQLPKEKAPVTHKITYQVTDLSGKTTTKTSTITMKYNEFPVIKAEDRYFTLEDAKAGRITQDVLLKDAITSDKLKATDAEDGTISNRITIVDYKDTDFKNVNGNTVVWVTFKVKDSMGKETIQEIKVNVIDSGSDYWRDDDEAVRKQVRFITQKYYDKNKDADFHGMTTEEIEASSDNGGLNVMSKWYQNAVYKALLTGSFAKDAGTDYKISAEKAKELKQKIESNGIGNSKSSNALTDIYNSLK